MALPFDCITDLIFVETGLAPADILLVPGGSHPRQMERAAELYHQGMAPYILPSGGFNEKIGETEWALFNRVGRSLGVPESAMLKEDRARNTFDNARNSWKVLQEHGLRVTKAILVCKAAHSRRALMTYQTVFPAATRFQIAPVISRLGITRDNWFLEEARIRAVMAEVEKIGKYFGRHIPNWVTAGHNQEG